MSQEKGPDSAAAPRVTTASAHRRDDAALRASEVRYRRLFETAKDGLLLLDADTHDDEVHEMNGLTRPGDALRLFLRAMPDPHLPDRWRIAVPARDRAAADAGARPSGGPAGLPAPRHPEILVASSASVRRLLAAARPSTAVVAN